VINKENIVNS